MSVCVCVCVCVCCVCSTQVHACARVYKQRICMAYVHTVKLETLVLLNFGKTQNFDERNVHKMLT